MDPIEMPNSSTEGLSEEARERLGVFADNLERVRDALANQYDEYVPVPVRAAVEYLAMGMLKAHIRIEHLTAQVVRLEDAYQGMESLHHMDGGEVPSSVKHTHWDHQQWWELVQDGMDSAEAAVIAGSA